METLPSIPQADYAPIRQLVLDAVPSASSRDAYGRALDDFFRFRESQGAPPFTRALVQAHRVVMEAQGLAPSTVNQRLSAIRKLASEAAANGLMTHEQANAIKGVQGPRQRGVRMGNWLTKSQAQTLLNDPSADTLRGKRNRAVLGLLIGCGLRRAECASVTVEHIQQRDGRWCIVDLRGKGGRIRTVPVPAGVKTRVDIWCEAAGITTGCIVRPVNRHGKITHAQMTPDAILKLTREYSHARPHDLRRTCAKLCRKAGGDLEQIQILLGHASIATTERYLGSDQDLEHAPNDRLGLKFL